MVTTERFFAIPCPCGGRISVSAGQAGGRATCSECRREVDVPRLRDLAAYADDKDHVDKDHARDRVTAASGWDLSRGLVFAGCAAAALAALAALAAEPVGGLIVGRPPPPQAIRRDVDAAPIAAVHAAYTQASQAGVNRPPSAQEVRLQQFSRLARSLSRTLWGLAAAGGLVAGAGIALRSTRGPARDDGPSRDRGPSRDHGS